MIRRMSDQDVQDNFSELLESVRTSNDRVVVERMGKPTVVLLSSDDYEVLARLQTERDWALIEQLRDDNADADPDEVMALIDHELAIVRRERREELARRDTDATGH